MIAIETMTIDIEATPANDVSHTDNGGNELARYRKEFQSAVDKERDWREEAKEDFEFYCGKQWSDNDRRTLNEQGRPTLTINRVRPLINLLSGYQRFNRYESEFLPRTKDDIDLCTVRKGITKYIFDQCDYNSQESAAYLNGIICGKGWLECTYEYDYKTLDGYINIRNVSPFDIYVDPESVKIDYSDARFIFKAKWVDKDELIAIYPEHKDDINAMTSNYDENENENDFIDERLWYQRDNSKIRVVDRWGKKIETSTFYLLKDGKLVPKEEMNISTMAMIAKPVNLPHEKVFVSVFAGHVLLEEKDSPYEHGEFPLVPYFAYYLGEGDIPSGVVRGLKDVQREVNKRRSQSLDILGKQANSGWMYEQGAIDNRQKGDLKKFGATPGSILEVNSLNSIQRINPPNPPIGLMQAEQAAVNDIRDISGINEGMLGTDISNATSGRAIELRQRQAITHIGVLSDNLRRMKQQLMFLLWGKKGRKGLVQQYYTEEKTFRIIGENGKTEFIDINKQVSVDDPLIGTIVQTINDLSVGEFDVIVSDTPSTATQRQSQFWALTDAVGKLGIPGDMVFDIILDLSDIPNREEIKKRWSERQEQMKQSGATPPHRVHTTINIKDLQPEAQSQMLAQIGIQPSQNEQHNPLVDVVRQLPANVVVSLSRLDGQQLYGAATLLLQQLPMQVQQQLGQIFGDMSPEQIVGLLGDAVRTVVGELSGSAEQAQFGYSAEQMQGQMLDDAGIAQSVGNKNVGQFLNQGQNGGGVRKWNHRAVTQPAIEKLLSESQLGI